MKLVDASPTDTPSEFDMDDAWDDNPENVIRATKEINVKKAHGSNNNDDIPSKIIIHGAKLVEKITDRSRATDAEKCDQYILAMHDLKGARIISRTKSEQKKIEKGLNRLCKKSWKYRATVGKDNLTQIYDDIGIKSKPRSDGARVLLIFFFVNLLFIAWSTWPPKENLMVRVKDLLNSWDISGEMLFWYLLFFTVLSFIVVLHLIASRRLLNVFILLVAIAMIVVPSNFETITFELSNIINTQEYFHFDLEKYTPINKSISIKGEKYSVSLTELDLSNKQLTSYDIKHLKYMINLKFLILENNQIQDISPLCNLTNLNFLTLENNRIQDIGPLGNLTNLEALYLDNNDISDIAPLSGLIKLEVLSLKSNQISNIVPLTGLTNIQYLFLHNNRIQDISPLQNLINLKELFLRANVISDIGALAYLNNLTRLALGTNRVSDISPLTDLTNLYELELHSNKINDISPLKNLCNLRMLLLSNNQISDISPLKSLISLNELSICKGNSIHSTDIRALHRLLPNVEIS